jgi:hypothetical protein
VFLTLVQAYSGEATPTGHLSHIAGHLSETCTSQGGEKRLPVAHFDSLTATSLEPPKKSSTYLRGYASGFFVVSALLRQNSQNAHY